MQMTDTVPETGALNRRSEIRTGLKLSVAAGMGMFPIGVAFGLLVVQYGFPWWVAPAFSLFLFAGSTELLVIGLLVSGAALPTIALTTFLVNFRHIFYAFSFPLDVVKNRFARFYSVFALIDEAYAVTAARARDWSPWRLLSMQIAFHAYWVGGGITGVLLAAQLPDSIEGLEFALCALFVTLTLDACTSRRQVPSVVLAGMSFLLGMLLLPDNALFFGLLCFMGCLALRYALRRGRGPRSRTVDEAAPGVTEAEVH